MVDVDASFTTSLVPVVSVTAGRGRIVAATFATDLVVASDLKVDQTRQTSANLITSFAASVSLSNASVNNRAAAASFITSLAASVTLSGVSDTRGRTLCDLVKESLSLWGFLCPSNAPQYALDRAITDINTALQMVWNNADGKDYWSQEEITIPLANGEDSYTLSDSVQNVVGPCRRTDNKRPLTPVATIGELETFVDLYLNGEVTDEPIAYHVERMKQSAVDPAKCVFRVAPPVFGDTLNFTLEIIKECPRYTVGDLASCPLVPIPHQYAETLLIPIIRYHASSYFLFSSNDQKETIDREYVQARASLGLADPNPVKGGGEA